jgi:hypothetical protein
MPHRTGAAAKLRESRAGTAVSYLFQKRLFGQVLAEPCGIMRLNIATLRLKTIMLGLNDVPT